MAKLRVDKIAAPIVKDEFTGSVFFDGNGDHLNVPLSSDFNFGAGDFTIEAWIYVHTAKDQSIFGTNNSSSNQGYELDIFTNGSIRFYSGNGSAYNYGALGLESSAGAVPVQTWTHIVASRQQNTLRLFVNGVLTTTNTSFTHTITDSTIAPDIGNDGRSTGTDYHFHGYISNLRVCKGHAVYTGNFTVPTRELEVHTKPPKGVVFPAADNITTLLACQSSTDATLDSSGRHAITAAGNVHAQSANPGLLRKTNIFSKYSENTGSIYFDGTGDYLATEVSNDFALGTNDFTFEMWVYYESRNTADTPAVLDSTTTTYAPLIGYIENDASTNGHAVVYISANGSSWGIASNKTFGLITAKQWYHLAISRSGSNFYLFKDGILTDSFTSSSAIYQDTNQIGFGRIQSNTYFDGYISNARMCNGHAVYTENFTPPTRELEVHPETVFLGLYDGENIFAEKTGKIIAAYGDRLSSPTPTATDSPIGITTHNPGLTREVDPVEGPTFGGGAGFVSQNWLTLPKGTTAERMPNFATNAVTSGGTRAVYHSGETPTTSTYDTLEYLNIATLGSVNDFGNLSNQKLNQVACSSNTRGLFATGYTPSPASGNSFIDYVTIMSTGDAKDFGDLTFTTYVPDACSNQIRGFVAGGAAAPNYSGLDNIDYVTISTLGNGTDFGNLIDARHSLTGLASPTRGIFGAGQTNVNTIEYITIASTGNGSDFGDLLLGRAGCAGASSSTRGLFAGGYTATPAVRNIIEFITIATMGNSQDFGDLTAVRRFAGATSSTTRGVFIAGYNPSMTNTIDYVNIQTTGNAVDFGETINKTQSSACSNGHGGLG